MRRLFATFALLGCHGSAADIDAEPEPPYPDAPPYDPSGVLDYELALGATAPVYGDAANTIAGMPTAGFAIDALDPAGAPVRKVFATFSQTDDKVGATPSAGTLASLDGGQTFGGYQRAALVSPMFAARLRDERIVSFDFIPAGTAAEPGGSRLTLVAHASADDGRTWQPMAAVAHMPALAGMGRICGHPSVIADGTLIVEWYGKLAGDIGHTRAVLLASSDGGATFTVRGTIARAPVAGEAYPEADVVELPGGDLFAVVRHHVGGGTLAPLVWARSKDAGATWSAPAPVMLPFGGTAAPRTGVNPQLRLLPDGALVLGSGRPDNFVAISTTGDTVTWRDARVTYANYPTATSASYGPGVLRVHGSSGNQALAVVDASRLIQIGDNCANSWGCPAADRGFTIDNRYRVWRRFIDVLPPDVGKLDLRGKLRTGAIQIDTDMTWTAAAHPRTRSDAALDGSTDDWAGAIKAGAEPATYTVALDRTYDLTRVGLALHRGGAEAATVEVSIDGRHWRATPLATYAAQVHRAIAYVALATPVRAAFVRVTVQPTTACPADVGDACSILSELELYATIDGFENDPVGGAPRGYRDVALATVTADHALHLADTSATQIARAVWQGKPAATKTLAFTLQPVALPHGFLFDVLGRDAAGAAVTAYHLAVQADGSLARYDGAAWIALGGKVAIGAHAALRVEAALDHATLFLDDQLVATVPPSAAGAVSLDGHGFASAGTATTGDDVMLDDVYFQ